MQYVPLDLETTTIALLKQGKGSIHCGCVGEEVFPWEGGHLERAINNVLAQGDNFLIHNAAFDVWTLRMFGVNIPPGRYIDTMVLGHSINPQRLRHSLSSYAVEFGSQKIDYMQRLIDVGLWEKRPKSDPTYSDYFNLPYHIVKPYLDEYCLQDGKLLTLLWGEMRKHLAQDEKLARSFYEVHLPFVEVIISLSEGLHIDCNAMLTLANDLLVAIERAEEDFYTEFPLTPEIKWDKTLCEYKVTDKLRRPNLLSPNDVHSLLFSYGWIPSNYKRDTKKPVASQMVLGLLLSKEDTDPKLRRVTDCICKIKSLYGILSQVKQCLTLVGGDSRIKGNWNQVGTVTHRMSSSQPNLQNFSTRHPVWGKRMRSCFTPPPGYDMLCGDLSQIELTILAWYLEILCDDHTMAEANRQGRDIHDANTEAWYHVTSADELFSLFRKRAKNGIFAGNYGAMAPKLSETLGITLEEAQDILDTIAESTAIGPLKEILWEMARKYRPVRPVPSPWGGVKSSGFFYDIMGTRHFYPDITSTERYRRIKAERQAFNCLMQGGCASLMYHLLNNVLDEVQTAGGWIAAIVHDEAIIYVPKAHTESVLQHCNKVFNEHVFPTAQGGVHVRADFHVVQNWSEK